MIAFLDSVIPIVPSETTLIIGGVAVATGVAPYSLWPVLAVGAVGAFLGDNASFGIGQHFAPRLERRAARRPKFAKRLDGARRQLGGHGGVLLITARFLPGGRTMLTLRVRRHQAATLVVRALGCAGGDHLGGLRRRARVPRRQAVRGSPIGRAGTALGTSVLLNVVVEVIRRRRHRSHPTPLPETTGEAVAAAQEQ